MSSWPELRKEFYDVLRNAFTVSDIERLLRYECDRSLEEIVSLRADLQAVADKVLQHAISKQWLPVLVNGMIAYNRSNADVQRVGKAVIAFVAERPDEVYRRAGADESHGEARTQAEVAFQKDLRTYLAWVEKRYSQLNLRGIEERARKIHELRLDDVYISLRAVLDPDDEEKDAARGGHKRVRREMAQLEFERRQRSVVRTVDMAELLSTTERLSTTEPLNGQTQLAITGGPGSGKTTFLHIIASAIARAWNRDDRSEVERHLKLEGKLPIPIVVSLSEYNRYRRRHKQNGQLRSYITQSLFERELNLDDKFFEQLLAHKHRCLLLLDGLDEVANENERLQVREAVENLACTGDVAQMIVTSRTHAYFGETQLADFRVAQVQPMQPEQVTQLVKRWCGAVYRDTAEIEREQAALNAAITSLEIQRQQRDNPPLIDSPLMVTIVAIVHYNEHRLPDQRAELYEKCVDVLLTEKTQRTEATRGELRQLGGTIDEKRQLLGQLAWEMMCAGKDAGRVVSERKLRKWLQPRIEMLYGEAERRKRLNEFVTALRERGSLLSERDKQYQFSHLTFQEYLCAVYLAEEVLEQDKIVAALGAKGRTGSSWWREVILLLIGYAGKRATTRPFHLMEALLMCGETAEVQLVTATTITTAYLELDRVSASAKEKIQQRLVELLQRPKQAIAPKVRATAGRVLAQIGDPRHGVGALDHADGIRVPGIAWSEVVPAGTYMIGDNVSEYDDEKPRAVTIERPYRLAKYVVTYQQYQCFLDAGDYANAAWWTGLPEDEREHNEQAFKHPTHPRENVSWYQAVAFCRWLADKLGMDVRLPHEHEWEVAARYIGNGKVDGRIYPWGDEFDATKLNNNDTGLGQTSPVGIFADGMATQLRLYDMSGNVFEWCQNKFDDVTDVAIDQSDRGRTLRGGSWLYYSDGCRAAYRLNGNPLNRNSSYGFRVCVVL